MAEQAGLRAGPVRSQAGPKPEGAGLVAGPDRCQAGAASEPTGPKAGPGRFPGQRVGHAHMRVKATTGAHRRGDHDAVPHVGVERGREEKSAGCKGERRVEGYLNVAAPPL